MTANAFIKEKQRNSKFELMRIVCILMVIAYHYVDHGSGNDWAMLRAPFSVNQIVAVIMGSWGQIGVFGFIIISCYFLTEKKSFHSIKILQLILQAFLYSGIYGIIGFFVIRELGLKELILEMITPLYNQYWFITAYIVFYLISPFLKTMVDELSDHILKVLCFILTIMVPCYSFFWTNIGGDLAIFVYIFLLMSYLKRIKYHFFYKYSGRGFVGIILIVIGFSLTINFAGTYWDNSKIINQSFRFAASKNLFMLLAALFMFYFFLRLKVPYSRVINKLASASLGIYILHENMLLKEGERALLWDGILKVYYWYESPYFVIHLVCSVIGIFVLCAIIELSRARLIDDNLFGKSKRLCTACEKFDKWYLS